MPDIFVDQPPGTVQSSSFTVTTSTDVTVDFSVETDALTLYRERRDGSFSPLLKGAEVRLNGKNCDNVIIVRPGNYQLRGELIGTASATYTPLP